ncbi:DNA-processing protein DprA [Actinokineospora xionganensis]|uniref:DNA-processing protein DprA n=1 Tax=Actinokineospora xionganensis TaxID=2684470 RepID=A0ABR7L4W0_9PSEU|nr:DNA-processing protein DprA [Actinokineospora xionganensis]MBC6447612.1 DNA-processing protein DprA [Actinokineospora xionganensis]
MGTSDHPDVIERELWLALLAPRACGGARSAVKVLLQSGRHQLMALIDQLDESERVEAESSARRLREDGVRVLLCDDPSYPGRLRCFPGAPPTLFYRGPLELLNAVAVGVCGARDASARGLGAAHACGEDAARSGVTVVSGYARGVDTQSHLAALNAGGATIAVLAEGIDHFRLKQDYRTVSGDVGQRMLVISQFPPSQRWTAGAAMSRNHVIVGLGRALVVVEARGSGGTLKAGELALRTKRPTLVLGLTDDVPIGNQRLLAAGARQIMNREQLLDQLQQLHVEQTPELPLG